MMDIDFTFSEAVSLLEKLRNFCREWSLADLTCIEDALLRTLSDVRMSANAQHPVNRLPVEILSKIFHQVPPLLTSRHNLSLEELLVWESLFEFKDTNALLPLTHVCRRWRDVALDTPTLWTTIYGSSHPRAVGEYYRRSQHAPLRVLNIENKYLDVQQLWRTDGQRIQSLASNTGCDSDLPTSYAHGLRALVARDCVLQGDVSNLKVLVLRAVDWHPPSSLTNLTHLFLARKRLHIVDLFRILSIAPRLEDLGLDRISAGDAFDPHGGIHATTLQYLRHLAIRLPNRNIVSGFFSHVGLPARLAVNFECCQVSDLQWLVPLTQNDAKSLYISASMSSMIAAGPSKAVRFSCEDNDEPGLVPGIAALSSHFQLRDLWLAHSFNWDEFDEAVIRHSPWVQTLHLGSLDYTALIETLGNNPTCWPKLTKVVLSQPRKLSQILKLVEARAHLGCPLEELDSHEWRSLISEEYLQDLEKIKSHVGVVRLFEGGRIAFPLPDICTDGVPSPYFQWPNRWAEMA